MMIKALVILVICAQVSAEAQSLSRVKRVIGGEDSDHSQNPYMVSMQAEVVTRRFFGIPISHKHVYCGGTLIADRWVLTAAHCFKEDTKTPSDWHARIASPNIKRSISEAFSHVFGKIFGVVDWQQMEYHPKTIIIHPSYVAGGFWDNDVALVELRETVPLSESDRVGLVELAESGEDVISSSCKVYGWGCDGRGSPLSSTLQTASLPIISDRSCRSIWGVSSQTKICAGGNTGSAQSACQGDSGGPLVCRTRNGVRKQVGVISFVSSSNPVEFPVVFSRVSWYAGWIKRTIGQ